MAQDGTGRDGANATQADRDPGGAKQAQPALAGHQQLGAQLASPTGTAGQRTKGGRGGEDHYIPALKADVESLIAEATAGAGGPAPTGGASPTF